MASNRSWDERKRTPLDDWLDAKGSPTTTRPLSELSQNQPFQLGIQVSTYLHQLILTDTSYTQDNCVSAVGGSPMGLAHQVLSHIRLLQKHHIEPLFVFDGIALGSVKDASASPLGSSPPGKTKSVPRGKTGKPDAEPAVPTPATSPLSPTGPSLASIGSSAWAEYENENLPVALDLFRTASHEYIYDHAFKVLIKLFKQQHISSFVAPYESLPQLYYLRHVNEQKPFVQAVYGASEYLLFDNALSVITRIDWAAQTFTSVAKADVMSSLKLSAGTLLDAALVANIRGIDLASAADLTRRGAGPAALTRPLPSKSAANSGNAALTVNTTNHPHTAPPATQLRRFARDRCRVTFPLVLLTEGRVLPLCLDIRPKTLAPSQTLTAADVPRDLHVIFSARLPDELYYLLWRGLIQPEILSTLARGLWPADAPLCGDQAPRYREFCAALDTKLYLPLAFGLLKTVLHPAWKEAAILTEAGDVIPAVGGVGGNKTLSGTSSAAPNTPASSKSSAPTKTGNDPERSEVSSQTSQSPPASLGPFPTPITLTSKQLARNARRLGASSIDIPLCLALVATKSADSASEDWTTPGVAIKKDDVVVNALMRFLAYLGYIQGQELTVWGSAVLSGMRGAKAGDRFHESLFLFVELFRAHQVLPDSQLRVLAAADVPVPVTFDTAPPRLSGSATFTLSEDATMEDIINGEYDEATGESPRLREQRGHMLLVMRVLSLLPLTLVPGRGWAGPFSRELVVFNGYVSALTRRLRVLLDATLVRMFLRGEAEKPRTDYLDIAAALPFHYDISTGMGMLIMAYVDVLSEKMGGIDAVAAASAEARTAAREETLSVLERSLPMVKNVRAELVRGVRFWRTVMAVLGELKDTLPEEDAFYKETIGMFSKADAWFGGVVGE